MTEPAEPEGPIAASLDEGNGEPASTASPAAINPQIRAAERARRVAEAEASSARFELELARAKLAVAEARLAKLSTQRFLERAVRGALRRLFSSGRVTHLRILVRRAREVRREDGVAEVFRRAVRLFGRRGAPLAPSAVGGVPDIEKRYRRLVGRIDPRPDELERQREAASWFEYRPTISIVVAVFDPPAHVLTEMAASVLQQTYSRLELCIANAGRDSECRRLLDEFARTDPRVRVRHLDENYGISRNTNAAIRLARGEFVAFIDHDDVLAEHALFAVAEALNARPDLDVLYSDEDRLSPEGTRCMPFLKPDWSPELLHSFMYVGHLTVYRRSLVESLGGLRSGFDGSQDYDLILRAAAATHRVQHLPQVLYHWRMLPTSAAAGAKQEARGTNVAALAAAIASQGRDADVLALSYANRIAFRLPDGARVSIVIPTDDLERITDSLRALYTTTTYENLEVIVVTNSTTAAVLDDRFAERGLRTIRFDDVFNFSLKCNRGADAATGEYLVFLNDDVEPLTPDWVERLLEYAQLPEIGGVSPKLLYADDSIQYAGLVTGVRDLVGTAFHTWARNESAYTNLALSLRNVSCLCGACMMVRARDFHAIRGWDAVNTPTAHSDFDLSFRLVGLGRRLVYTPFAELRHLGHQSIAAAEDALPMQRDRIRSGADLYMLGRWGPEMSRDPYFPDTMRRLVYWDDSDYRIFATASAPLPDRWWERTRVLLFGHELSATGAPMILLELARFLRAHGMLVAVMSPKSGPLLGDYARAQIPVIIDEDVLHNPLRSRSLFQGFDLLVPNTVLAWRVVHAARELELPSAWLVHESEFGFDLLDHAGAGKDAEDAFALADVTIFPARRTARIYERFRGSNPHVAVHYGIKDVAAERRLRPPFKRVPGCLHIVHVGSLERRKGALVLLDAVDRLSPELRERITIFLVGRRHEPDYVARVERLARELPSVHIVGDVSRADALSYIQNADIFVCTSREETGPIVLIEALALGTCVISTRVGAADEIIRNGIEGYLIDVGDAVALADRLEKLLLNQGQLETLGRAARRTYERRLTLDRYGADILEHFESALRKSETAAVA